MTITLPDTLVTPQDLSRVEVELASFSDWFGHNMVKRQLQLSKGTSLPSLSPETMALLRQTSTADGNLSQDSLQLLIDAVKTLGATAPTMTVTLAAPASAPIRRQLASWCRNELSPAMLISFRFNSTLLGGVVLRVGSRVFDFSFRRKLLDNNVSFAEVLRHV